MSRINELMATIKDFIQGSVKEDMSVDELNKHNEMLKACDDVLEENKAVESDLLSAKDTIVNMVKNQGSSNPPKEAEGNKPKSLEEIALSVIGGKK